MDGISAKADWRRQIRDRRRARLAVPGAATARIALARVLADHLLTGLGPPRTPDGRPAVVAAYRALPTEPPTMVLLHELLRRGRTVLVPEMLPDRDLGWRTWTGAGRPGALGAPAQIASASLVVVPALAVDRAGTRLGQGGGSYDRALRRVAPGVPVVALLYDDEALLGSRDPLLPREEHDVPVTTVLTPGSGWRWPAMDAVDGRPR